MAQNKIASIFDLTGKIAVVTGGYGHLGKAMVRSLYECGATVVVAGRMEEKYLKVFSEVERERIQFSSIDIMKTDSINTFFDRLSSEFGRLDILINNAHSAKGSSQENLSDDEWAYTMEGVVGSVHKMIRSAAPIMKENKSGKIINITSMYGIVSPDFDLYSGDNCEKYTNPPHYGAAKAAMIQLTRYYAVLYGPKSIQVNSISPGPFPKKHIQAEDKVFIERLKNRNPLNKIGKPDDLIGVVALLSSSASDFITGQTLQVDGGWTIW